LQWVKAHFSTRQKIIGLAIFVGLAAGLAAVVLKNTVHLVAYWLQHLSGLLNLNYFYFIYPIVGIFLAYIFMKFIIKRPSGHGVPGILFALSQRKGIIDKHNMYSSIITSSLTVGFGGSVGLEGPISSTGAAIGSNIGRVFNLNYSQIRLMIGCASAGAVASIFNAPIAGIIFSLEILMLDLAMSTLIPLLIASVAATLTSYLFIGNVILYPFIVTPDMSIQNLHYYIILGILCGLISAYFSTIYTKMSKFFEKLSAYKRLLIGGGILGLLIFLFPSLYGEGYKEVNFCLANDVKHIFDRSIFTYFSDSTIALMIVLLAIILLKSIATSATFGAGGVGGIFAPSLFLGAHFGVLFAIFLNYMDFGPVSVSKFALIGMAGMMSGILYAPFFAIFLIAEISGGYAMMIPLMIVSASSYIMVRRFSANSVYTKQLAEQNLLLTHDVDKSTQRLMKIDALIETNFTTVHSYMTLGDLIKTITISKRNIFPVIDNDEFKGIVFLDDIRHIILNEELYNVVTVRDFMYMPIPVVKLTDNMENVVKKFNSCNHYNLPVLEENKYIGFVSRANIFSAYQKVLSDISQE